MFSSNHDSARAAKRRRRIFLGQRDRLRGWSLNGKFLGVAMLIETAIIVAGVWAGISFANTYAGGTPEPTQVASLSWVTVLSQHTDAWWIAVVGALMLAF